MEQETKMIDFEKELKKFRFLDTDEDFIQLQNESSVLFKAFHSTLKRLSREQNQTNTQLEEVIGLAEASWLLPDEPSSDLALPGLSSGESGITSQVAELPVAE